ncbi:MAG: hypothetical protein Q9218_007278 [Villophora microphyllina]
MSSNVSCTSEKMSLGVSRYFPVGDRQIRLVKLHRSLFRRRVGLSYFVVDLDHVPEYVAISYVWGSDNFVANYGVEGEIEIPVTASAEDIISELSKGLKDFLWMDALCIDQKDPKDKEKQIPLMGEIYSSARKVSGWLGRQLHDGDLALTHVRDLYFHFRNCEASNIVMNEKAIYGAPDWDVAESRKWKALAHLLQCPFFERMWIVQEIVMAPFERDCNGIDWGATLVCRKAWLPFDVFVYVVDKLLRLGTLIEPWLPGLSADAWPQAMQCAVDMGALRDMRKHNRAIPFDFALRRCSNSLATLGVDKIYAIRNFVQRDTFVDNLLPDNTNNDSVEKLFTKVAVEFLKRQDPFQFLHIAGNGWPLR